MRSEVTKALLGALDGPNVTYRTWGDAAGLAGDIRAAAVTAGCLAHSRYSRRVEADTVPAANFYSLTIPTAVSILPHDIQGFYSSAGLS